MKAFFYTSRGLVPHMSQGRLDAVHISLPQVYSLHTALHSMNLLTYLGLPNTETLLSIKDTMQVKGIAGNADFERIRVINKQREESITVEDYMKFAVSSGCTHVVSFSEEASSQSGNHRAQRSARQAVETVAKCLEMKSESMKVYGNIQGGKAVGERMRCAKYMKMTQVQGFYIGGLYAEDDSQVIRDIIQFVCAELRGDDRPIILSGLGRPVHIVLGAIEGISLFEVGYPFVLAQKGEAMMLNLPSKLPAMEEEMGEVDVSLDYEDPTMNLKDEQYASDLQPLLPLCQCYTCTHHSRAYLHHLLVCEELTGTALLTLHNVFTVNTLFDRLNEARETQELGKAGKWILKNAFEVTIRE